MNPTAELSTMNATVVRCQTMNQSSCFCEPYYFLTWCQPLVLRMVLIILIFRSLPAKAWHFGLRRWQFFCLSEIQHPSLGSSNELKKQTEVRSTSLPLHIQGSSGQDHWISSMNSLWKGFQTQKCLLLPRLLQGEKLQWNAPSKRRWP